jgi:hypothetical protein
MKIIEAMKQLKLLAVKTKDLRDKVSKHCADLSFETPLYPDTRGQIAEWIQAHTDILQKVAELRVAIQRTNLATPVTIELGGKHVTKSIAEWIHRRRDLSETDLEMWKQLTDRGLKEGQGKTSQGAEIEVKIRRYFDPKLRDEKIELYRSEKSIIDYTLETVNAVTDIIEE